MDVTESAVTVIINMLAGAYFKGWHHVSVQTEEVLHWLFCTCMLRRALWGAKLYWDIDEAESWSDSILWDSIPKGGHSATYTDTQQRKSNVNCISKMMFLIFLGHKLTHSLALWRHVVCSWLDPLPPSASALSLAEVRETVLRQNLLHWIFSNMRNDLRTHHY